VAVGRAQMAQPPRRIDDRDILVSLNGKPVRIRRRSKRARAGFVGKPVAAALVRGRSARGSLDHYRCSGRAGRSDMNTQGSARWPSGARSTVQVQSGGRWQGGVRSYLEWNGVIITNATSPASPAPRLRYGMAARTRRPRRQRFARDLASLKIEASGLPAATAGDSSGCEWVSW